jgi:hypothetical protein
MSDEMDGAVDDLYDKIRALKAEIVALRVGIRAVRILVEQDARKAPILSLLDTMIEREP